jgi:uncharacterized protein (DUF1697 family)
LNKDSQVFLALLRGINLGAKAKVPMKGLRTVFEDLGHHNVRTYVQSGNVIFESRSSTTKQLAEDIETALSKTFDFEIPVIIRTRREVKAVAAGNPFPTEGVVPSTLHVVFLAQRVPAKAAKALDPDRSPPDEFTVRGREIYLRFPNGAGRSKLTIDYFEKVLGTRATARNWNTVTNLVELMHPS